MTRSGSTWPRLSALFSTGSVEADYHDYWFHLILDEARHQGQIVLLCKYLIDGADAEFDPYMGLAAEVAAD